jgi:hypothetical protein
MTQRDDTNRDETILDGLEDAAGAPEATRRDYDRPEDDDLNDTPPGPRRDHDGPPRAVHIVCGGDPPPGWDDFDDVDPPPPDDPDDDCDIEGLGPPLSRGWRGYGWDSERDCMYRIDADEEGYEDWGP